MTIIEIKTALDAAIVTVNEEVATSALVPPFTLYPSQLYSDQFRDSMRSAALDILNPEEFVSDISFSPGYHLCTSEGFLVLTFTYDDLVAGNHRVRYEIKDRFFKESR